MHQKFGQELIKEQAENENFSIRNGINYRLDCKNSYSRAVQRISYSLCVSCHTRSSSVKKHEYGHGMQVIT